MYYCAEAKCTSVMQEYPESGYCPRHQSLHGKKASPYLRKQKLMRYMAWENECCVCGARWGRMRVVRVRGIKRTYDTDDYNVYCPSCLPDK